MWFIKLIQLYNVFVSLFWVFGYGWLEHLSLLYHTLQSKEPNSWYFLKAREWHTSLFLCLSPNITSLEASPISINFIRFLEMDVAIDYSSHNFTLHTNKHHSLCNPRGTINHDPIDNWPLFKCIVQSMLIQKHILMIEKTQLCFILQGSSIIR